MSKQLTDEDITSLFFQELNEEDLVAFDSSGEEFDVALEDEEAVSEERENDAGSTSSDSKMDMHLSILSTETYREETYRGKDGTIWFKNPCSPNVRTRSENILTGTPVVNGQAKNAKSPLECFELFIHESILSYILCHTNTRIKKTRENSNASNEYSYCDVSMIELSATIGLIFLAGLFKSARQNLQDLWSNDGTGIALFPLTMSLRRFSFIVNHLRFDDASSREERLAQDRLPPFRFIKGLALALLEPHLQSRKSNIRLSTDFRKRIAERTGNQGCPPFKKFTPGIKRRCHVCPAKKDRKKQYICETCSSHICLDHSNFQCAKCYQTKDLQSVNASDEDKLFCYLD